MFGGRATGSRRRRRSRWTVPGRLVLSREINLSARGPREEDPFAMSVTDESTGSRRVRGEPPVSLSQMIQMIGADPTRPRWTYFVFMGFGLAAVPGLFFLLNLFHALGGWTPALPSTSSQ